MGAGECLFARLLSTILQNNSIQYRDVFRGAAIGAMAPPFEGTQTDTDVILIRKSYIRAALPLI